MPDFRRYNYLTGMKIWPPGASGEVVLGFNARKMAAFKEIFTKSRKREASAACGFQRMIIGFRCGSMKKGQIFIQPCNRMKTKRGYFASSSVSSVFSSSPVETLVATKVIT